MKRETEQPDAEIFEKIAELLSLFGDTTRVRIMAELLDKELCVSEIAERLEMTTSAISHQLRILKQGRLVKSRKEGKTVFYSLADSHVGSIFSLALEHVQES
ncbi:MAG: metalloregulator ArsR/SmtB family transcription factor [Oscillospiraceae bacterium]|nr:metalloregulator ArsR/SmtB family transcription factor [Oscillospiraceae bacterium]